MLVLTRRTGEALRLGSDIRITVAATSNGQVRLAIDAPDDIAILREEVWERTAAANIEAARVPELAGKRASVSGLRPLRSLVSEKPHE